MITNKSDIILLHDLGAGGGTGSAVTGSEMRQQKVEEAAFQTRRM